MKLSVIIIGLVFIAGAAFAVDKITQNQNYNWRYKMTVTVDTPEGEVSGSAVRQMGNNYQVTFPPEASNYGEVSGEAVVVDLGERGVLFVLISDKSDHRFYHTFPTPWGGGGETPEGYEYYASLPMGAKAEMPLSAWMPQLVTFTDMDDPKSVTLVYKQDSCREQETLPEACKDNPKGSFLTLDRFEELFGEGVSIRDITLEITDEPVTWGVVDEYLPDVKQMVREEWKNLSYKEKGRISKLITFKQGELK